jgi:hypothetical protein
MENTHEFKTVHDPLFCQEGDVPYDLNIEKATGYESTKSKFYNPGNIPACNPENTCEVIQDFLEDGESTGFSTFRKIQQECYEEIYQCQNRIEECKKKILAEIQDIKAYKQKLDDAFNKYIS